jgi:hypothetical protein
MAFLATPAMPCPSWPARLASLFERIDWPTVASLAMILATVLLQASLMAGERQASLSTGVCEQRPSLFFPALH